MRGWGWGVGLGERRVHVSKGGVKVPCDTRLFCVLTVLEDTWTRDNNIV